ncbi:hypothetical protein D1BOALGB6SA_2268 [Olavius sp. associated proteobacterium Delta 1]|nr:hypothetical protein D1BOALGB6SA_2268 [Olavius sp. associated proteobacterium Delta 1]
MHGSADKAITMDQFADLAKELESAGLAHEMITYAGAQHAFTVFGENRYQAAADKKSWKRFQEFLAYDRFITILKKLALPAMPTIKRNRISGQSA